MKQLPQVPTEYSWPPSKGPSTVVYTVMCGRQMVGVESHRALIPHRNLLLL